MTETWAEAKARHRQELADLLTAQRDARKTQTEAAGSLGMCPRMLNNYLRRYGIPWPYTAQGKRSKKV